MRDSIFFSYCHEDHDWLSEIQTVLSPAIKNSNVLSWSDKDIKPGMKWSDEVDKALARAKVVVLLVSPSFLASSFVQDKELPTILRAAQTDGVRVIWVYVRPCLVARTEIADFQAAHDIRKPLNVITNARRSIALVEICEKILLAYEESAEPPPPNTRILSVTPPTGIAG